MCVDRESKLREVLFQFDCSPPLNLFEVVKTASICFCCFCLPEWSNLIPTQQNVTLIGMEVQKPWREIHAWCETSWMELSLPLCAAVPSHFKVHTSVFLAHLFLYETERVHPWWFICFQTSLCVCLSPQIKPRNIVANESSFVRIRDSNVPHWLWPSADY